MEKLFHESQNFASHLTHPLSMKSILSVIKFIFKGVGKLILRRGTSDYGLKPGLLLDGLTIWDSSGDPELAAKSFQSWQFFSS